MPLSINGVNNWKNFKKSSLQFFKNMEVDKVETKGVDTMKMMTTLRMSCDVWI